MRRILAASSLFAIALLGCGDPSLVGDWTVSSDKMPQGATANINFTSNAYKMDIKAGQAGVNLAITMDGTYTLKGEEMTMTAGNVTIDDSQIPAAFKAMIEPAKKQLEEGKGKTTTGSVKIEGETATFTGKDDKGQPVTMTFTKVKK